MEARIEERLGGQQGQGRTRVLVDCGQSEPHRRRRPIMLAKSGRAGVRFRAELSLRGLCLPVPGDAVTLCICLVRA